MASASRSVIVHPRVVCRRVPSRTRTVRKRVFGNSQACGRVFPSSALKVFNTPATQTDDFMWRYRRPQVSKVEGVYYRTLPLRYFGAVRRRFGVGEASVWRSCRTFLAGKAWPGPTN